MIPFSPPHIDQKIIDEIVSVLKSGWITTGPKTKLFEKELTAYCGSKSTLCLTSATSGLEIILRWFGVGIGDEVILPAYTYSATANVIVHCGATPVFVDINSDDFNISLASIEKAITAKTKVIMPVDFGGFPCDIHQITELAKKNATRFKPATFEQTTLNRILILSDAAHSLGASCRGEKVGSLSDITVFSFHAVKNLTTSEGGAVALNLPPPFDNELIYQHLCIKTLHGQNKDALAKTQKGNWRYDIVEAGYKYNMTDISAAMGLVELKRYEDDILIKRQKICEAYTAAFSKFAWAQLPTLKTDISISSYHLFPLRIREISEDQRDAIIQEIFDHEVSVNVHFIPLPMTSFYKNLGYNINDYPVAFDNYKREISLPVFYDLTDEMVIEVINAVVSSVHKIINT